MDAWQGAIRAYLTTMKAAGRASGTLRVHRHYLTQLALLNPSPWLVTTEQLLDFMARDGWAPETRKSACGVLRCFYRWGYGAGHVDHDPSVRLPTVRVPLGLPRPTPEHLVRQLVHHEDPRLGLMAMLAAFGGLRVAEISRVHGLDLEVDTLVVQGKGGKVRAVPVVNAVLLARLETVGDAWAFPNGLGGHLSPGHVSKLLSRAMPPRWTGHTLRHRMATTAYHGTRDLLAVQQVLGHARPETTQRYVRTPDEALRAVVRAAS